VETAGVGRRPGRWWTVAAVLCALSPVLAQRGPGRIAVAGVYPTGYVGCLARFGLTRDLLFDAQLSDPAVLKRYDLVIVAGMPPEVNADTTLTAYVEAGGAVLYDYSTPKATLAGVQAGERTRKVTYGTGGYGVAGMSRSAMRPVKGGPMVSEGGFTSARAQFCPDATGLTEPVVLVEYISALAWKQGEESPLRALFAAPLKRDEPAGQPGPAVIVGGRGKGRVMLCGAAVGLATGLMGMDFDSLILGMVRVLSGGRAVPQLAPEGPHLGRKQSLRSTKTVAVAAAEEVPEPEVPDRPAGPGERGKLPASFKEVEADPGDEFNVTGKVGATPGDVLLRYWNSANFVKVTLSSAGLRVSRLFKNKSTTLDAAQVAIPAGTSFTIKERCDKLLVTAGTAYCNVDLTGVHGGDIGQRGFAGGVAYQQIESVYFTDDFMRTTDQKGNWETDGGTWKTAPVQNPEMGANPFSYKVEAADTVATALTGYDFWDEYKFTCALRPGGLSGRVGLGLYAKDPNNMLLFQAEIRTDDVSRAGGFQLLKLVDGKMSVLAEVPGGVNSGQWYRVMVKCEGPWIGAFVDGQKIIGVKDTSFTGGKVALRADHASARFDDVSVEAVVLAQQRGHKLVGKVPEHAGLIDVDSWAGPATAWEPDPDIAGLFWRRNSFFGDLSLRCDLPKWPDGGDLTLVLDGDGKDPDSGYSMQLKRAGAKAKVALRHNGKVLTSTEMPVGDRLGLALRKERGRVVGAVGDKAVVQIDGVNTTEGGRLAFRTQWFQPKVSSFSVWSQNLKDYTFDAAPVDWWVASGNWDLTNRWSCTPDWSWFGGFSDDVAAIWNKYSYVGDVVVDYYAGPKMLNNKIEGWQGRQAKERVGDFNITIGGDGRNVHSGYAFVAGPGDRMTGAAIFRKGKKVAENKTFRFFTRGHNRWANVRAERHGSVLKLFVDGQLIVDYNDEQPLPGGYVAVWTQDNGIMIPRVTIAFENLGQGMLSLR